MLKILSKRSTLFTALICFAPFVASAQSPRHTPIPTRRHVANTDAKSLTSSPWQPLTNQPVFVTTNPDCGGAGNPLLLTDGTVLIQDAGCQDWLKLTPDNTGSYVNGTWSSIASLPSNYSPLYHASAVLPDGRVIIEGGEYNFFNDLEINLGAIYDPQKDKWTSVAPPAGWATIGDAASIVLANGTFMLANCCTTQEALFNPRSLTWTTTGSGKFDSNNEEGWTLLPNRDVLAIDAYVPINIPYEPTGTNSEIYNPKTGSWQSAGSTIVQLWDSAADCGGENVGSFELGPQVLRPDGTVLATGANSCGASNTAIYDTHAKTWSVGPTFPANLGIADGPCALVPSGNVLCDASPLVFETPSYFFEFDGTNLNPVPGPPNAPFDSSYYGNMLVLPTGQILFTDFSDDIEIYTPSGTYKDDWRPEIQYAPGVVFRGGCFTIAGRYLNGFSQGAAYGDDDQSSTNYPLVRITNKKTGHVFYSRTHDFSSMAVASKDTAYAFFDVPAGQEKGWSELEVVTNGIPSKPFTVFVL